MSQLDDNGLVVWLQDFQRVRLDLDNVSQALQVVKQDKVTDVVGLVDRFCNIVSAYSEEVSQGEFTVLLEVLIATEIAHKHLELCLRIFHQNDSVGVFWRDLEDLTWFTSVNPLQDPDTLTEREELAQLFRLHFDFDRDLVEGIHGDNLCIADRQNGALATLELPFDDFASVTYLDLELRIIADSLHHGSIFEDVPLINI